MNNESRTSKHLEPISLSFMVVSSASYIQNLFGARNYCSSINLKYGSKKVGDMLVKLVHNPTVSLISKHFV